MCGFQNDSIPITYPQVLATPLQMHILADNRFPFPALGLVHLYQEIQYPIPLKLGLEFDIYCWVEGCEQVTKGVQFKMYTELRVDETVYWRGQSRILSQAVSGHGNAIERESEPDIVSESLL